MIIPRECASVVRWMLTDAVAVSESVSAVGFQHRLGDSCFIYSTIRRQHPANLPVVAITNSYYSTGFLSYGGVYSEIVYAE